MVLVIKVFNVCLLYLCGVWDVIKVWVLEIKFVNIFCSVCKVISC